jgi:hypothetical protein
MFWTLSQAVTELAENVWLYCVVDKTHFILMDTPIFNFILTPYQVWYC